MAVKAHDLLSHNAMHARVPLPIRDFSHPAPEDIYEKEVLASDAR